MDSHYCTFVFGAEDIGRLNSDELLAFARCYTCCVVVTDIIAKKRDRGVNTRAEFDFLLSGYTRGEVPDYQVSAWLMAAYLNGMSPDETLDLTEAMAASGESLDLSPLPRPHVDKHSTGGVGDKTSLVVVPLLAACGCTVVKMSGRGLGITGGTVDKLESIPGFRTQLTAGEMVEVAASAGCCLAGQSASIAPADGLLYALRDVTATVASVPLITASIMSKKLAAGADVISLDVKCGVGSFMPTVEDARVLARSLIEVGRQAGKTMAATITDMSAPLGFAVGNVLEVAEAVDTLSGRGPARFRALCLALAEETLVAAGLDPALAAARLDDGSARKRFARLLEAQGADPALAERPPKRDIAPTSLTALSDGWVKAIDARVVGEIAMLLGAGRRKKGDAVDPHVGVVLRVEVGDEVRRGQDICAIYARQATDPVAAELREAITISPEPTSPPPIILESVT